MLFPAYFQFITIKHAIDRRKWLVREFTDRSERVDRSLPLGCGLVNVVLRQILCNYAIETRLDRCNQIPLSHAVQFSVSLFVSCVASL